MSVRMGLLALLAEGPTHGYELKTAFEARTGGVWVVNVGQVYTTLDRLHADGLVEPVDLGSESAGRDRRPWRITSKGKGAVDDWFDETAIGAAPPRDDFLVKLLLALGRSRREALEVIDRHRVELHRLAHAERRRRRPASTDATGTQTMSNLASALMTEAVAARREADLQWLDHCESMIVAQHDRGTMP